MKAITFLPFLVIFLFTLVTSNTLACDCILPPENKSLEKQIKEVYKESTSIFLGRVIEVIKDPNALFVRIKFESEKIFKGKFSKEVIISTGRGGGDCGYFFEVGNSYLVYAYGNSDNLQTNICQRTSLIEETRDKKILDRIKKEKKTKFSQK